MFRKNFLAVTLLSLFFSIWTTPGMAHTELISSNPAAGSTIINLPNHLVLTFSEAPLVPGTYIRIEQPAGTITPKTRGKIVGSSMQFEWPSSIKPGQIKIYWRAVADDGHVVSGDFFFIYKSAAKPSISQSPETQATHIREIVKWGGLVMLIVLAIGVAAITRRRN